MGMVEACRNIADRKRYLAHKTSTYEAIFKALSDDLGEGVPIIETTLKGLEVIPYSETVDNTDFVVNTDGVYVGLVRDSRFYPLDTTEADKYMEESKKLLSSIY